MNDLKGILRLTTAMFLFVGLLGIWIGGCQTQEQKVEKLISKLQHKNPKIRQTAVVAVNKSRKRCGACPDTSITG